MNSKEAEVSDVCARKGTYQAAELGVYSEGRGMQRRSFPMIFIVVRLTVRPEYSDEWLERVRSFTESTRREPGNLWFEWSRSLEHPDQFVLIEAFRDAEAGAEHVQSDHFKQAVRDMPEMLVRTPDIVNVEVPGTEWSKLTEMSVEGD
jgi:quinol monooxygenase YgiN